MEKMDQNVKALFDLSAVFRHVLFKEFFHDAELPGGLNPTQIRTLMLLQIEGAQPMSDASHKVNLEKGSFTSVANKLITLNYIKKTQNEMDKRVYELSLTDSGKRVATEFATMHDKYINDRLSRIDEGKREDFFEAIKFAKDILLQISIRPDDIPAPHKICSEGFEKEVK